MGDLATIPGLAELWRQTVGDPRIRVAVVDGPVDASHHAFAGANLARADGAWPDEAMDGPFARHGTQVASVLVGQHSGPVPGVAPACAAISSPAFSDRRHKQSQLELARAIEAAVEAGAHVVNVSGGQLTSSGDAFHLLERAVRLCHERNVLVVAAAGNDGCLCDHVPAALPSVLAIGALGDDGEPLPSSNWGETYQDHGLLAPGESIVTATPGGATERAGGTSIATPIVAGIAALLLSLQLRAGRSPDPLAVGAALLAGADGCELEDAESCKRYLTGKLNIERAVSGVMDNRAEVTEAPVVASGGRAGAPCSCGGPRSLDDEEPAREPSPAESAAPGASTGSAPSSSFVYAFGMLDYDFASEARRDSFKQAITQFQQSLKPPPPAPAQPYDRGQMLAYLDHAPSEAELLTWTLSIELTPIYAIEAVGPYAHTVYERLRELLRHEFVPTDRSEYVERVSVPGRKVDRTRRLFSGQVVPVVEVEQTRALDGWSIQHLIEELEDQPTPGGQAPDPAQVVRDFLTRVYYDLRNLGSTSRDRALNFTASNIFQINEVRKKMQVADMLHGSMALDRIEVEKSPFCRMDSDCWDVKLTFFDTENELRAREVYRFSVDVSDLIPVTVGDVNRWRER